MESPPPPTIVHENGEHVREDAIDELVPFVGKRLHTRRTQSLSSSSFSLSSCSSSFRSTSFDSNLEDSPISSPQFSRVPFSWEQHPGIPKKANTYHSPSKNNSSSIILPLPPAVSSTPSKKFNFENMFRKKMSNQYQTIDPFTTALVECSKDLDHDEFDHYWKKGKITRGITDRFGLIDRYISCKSSCAVVQSMVLLPRSRQI